MAVRQLQYMISAKDNVSRVFGDVGIALGALGIKAGSVSKAMVGAGVAAITLGGTLLKMFSSTVSAAAQFETKMHEIWTLMEDGGKESLGAIQQSVFELSSRVPQDLNTLTEGLYWIMSSGYEGADAMRVLEQSAMLATATLTDTATASDILVKSLNAYGLSAGDATHVSDILFQTIKIGIVDMEDLAGPWGAVIGMAGMAGVKLEEVGAAFAALTRQGLGGAIAGTAIRGMINSLIGPSDYLKDKFQALTGQTIQTTLAQEGLGGVITRLQGYFNLQTSDLRQVADAAGDDEEQFLALAEAKGLVSEEMKKMFPNLRGLVGFMGILANGGDVWKLSLDAMATASGSTKEAFDKMMDTFSNKWALAKNAFDRLKISIGQGVLPLFSWLAVVVGKVADAIGKLPQPVKTFIGILMGTSAVTLIVAGLILLFKALGLIIVKALVFAAPYVLILIAVIGVLAIAINYLKKHWDTIGPAIQRFWNTVKPILTEWWNKLVEIGKAVWKWLGEAWDKIKGPLVSTLKTIWKGVITLWHALVSLWNNIKGPLMSVFKQLWGLFKQVYELFKAAWPIIKIVAIAIGVAFVAAIKICAVSLKVIGWILGKIVIPAIKFVIVILRVFASVTKVIINAIVTAFKFLWNVVKFVFGLIATWFKFVGQVFVAVWNAIVAAFRFVWGILVAIWNSVGKPFVDVLRMIWDAVYAVWSKIWEVIYSVLQFIWNLIAALFHTVWDALVAAATIIWDILVTVWQVIWGAIKAVIEPIWHAIVNVWNAIFPPLKNAALAIWDALSGAWNAVWGGIKSVVSGIWNGIVDAWNAVIGPLVSAASAVWNGLTDAWQGAWDGLKNIVKGAVNAVIGFLNTMIDAWNLVPFHDDVSHIGEMKHSGGYIPQTDTYYLQEGEYVLRKGVVNSMGLGAIRKLNAGFGLASPAMISGSSGGSPYITRDNSQNYHIQNVNVYNPNNVDDIMNELDQRANRANRRARVSKEDWE